MLHPKTSPVKRNPVLGNWVKMMSIPTFITQKDITEYISQWSTVSSFQFIENPIIQQGFRIALFQTVSRTKRRKLLAVKPHIIHGVKLKLKAYYPKQSSEVVEQVDERERKIYFNNFPGSLTLDDLESIFIRFGKVENIRIIRDSPSEDTALNLGYVIYFEKFPVERALSQKKLSANKFKAILEVGPSIASLYSTGTRIFTEEVLEGITKFEKCIPKIDKPTKEKISELLIEYEKRFKNSKARKERSGNNENIRNNGNQIEKLATSLGLLNERDFMVQIYSKLVEHKQEMQKNARKLCYKEVVCNAINDNHKNTNLRLNRLNI